MTAEQPWPWPMDALLAAPAAHRVLLDNDLLRVLDVVIEPGTREPEHNHRAPSVMITDESAPIRYYVGGALRFESQQRSGSPRGVRVRWTEPEGAARSFSVFSVGSRTSMAVTWPSRMPVTARSVTGVRSEPD